MKIWIVLLIIIVLTGIPGLQAQVVNTQYGQIQGSINGTVYQFLGIPFARPPVDTLRWKFPLNPEPWTNVRQVTDFAPVCPQKEFQQGDTTFTFKGHEDCLYLNVWTPQIAAGNLPVLVFIHGGGNQQGGASSVSGGTQMFFGKNMAERGNAVIVTIQYRLGPLGYLVHPGLEAENTNSISGNYASMDQILALTWVKNNISNFGGDTSKVMVFGESAGGVNVGNLLTSPFAEGLFQRACIQSASPVLNEYNDSKNKGIAYVNGYTTSGNDTDKIAFMRTLPADSLVKDLTNPISGGMVQMNWQPVVDNYVFPDFPIQSFQNGNYNKVPLMIGSNSEEMSLSAPATVYPFMVSALINSVFPPAYQAQATALYPPGNDPTQARQSYVGLLTDSQFTVTTRRTAQCVSQNQAEPIWRYFFTYKHSSPALATLGSYHGKELFYVFNTWENATLGSGILFKPQDDSMQKVMLNYWVNFAATGNPNGSGVAAWPEFNSAADCFMELKATPDGSHCGIRTAQCDLWDEVAGFPGCTSSDGIEAKKDLVFKAFPNPCSGIVTISSIRNNELQEILVYDFTGREVRSVNEKSQIDLLGLPSGIYLLKIRQKGLEWQAKIVKE